jgi:hypothetical protein
MVGPLEYLHWSAANLIDIAGFHTHEMAPNIAVTPEWADKKGMINKLEALKFDPAHPDGHNRTATQYTLTRWPASKKTEADQYLWKTTQGGLYKLNNDTFLPVSDDREAVLMTTLWQAMADFNTDEALLHRAEHWAIDKKSSLNGIEQTRKAFSGIIAKSEDIHKKVLRRSLAQRVFRRAPKVSVEKVHEAFPDHKSAVNFLRDSDSVVE